MAFKLVVLLAVVAVANAGFLAGGPAAVAYSAAPTVSHVSYASPVVSYGTPAITTQQQNVYRSPGNLAQVSTYSKTIDTPFSSVSKSDVRVSNPGYAVHAAAPAYAYAAPAAYHAAPAYSYAAAAPVVTKTYAAAPAIAYNTVPSLSYAAAAPVVTKTYAAAPALAYNSVPSYSYAAAAPVVTKTYAAAAGPVIAAPGHGLLGVAYSAAPAVSHMTYSNGLGLTYGW